MNAKVFSCGQNELEALLNSWLSEVSDIRIICQFTACMHDLYSYGEPTICNQWFETTVYYTEGKS